MDFSVTVAIRKFLFLVVVVALVFEYLGRRSSSSRTPGDSSSTKCLHLPVSCSSSMEVVDEFFFMWAVPSLSFALALKLLKLVDL